MPRDFLRKGIESLVVAIVIAAGPAGADAPRDYAEHCAACHGADRLGGMGPALLPSNLERLRRPTAERVVTEGRVATQMQGFLATLGADRIRALVEFIYRDPPLEPRWGESELRASRVVHVAPESRPSRPAYAADPLNLFVVVETGDHHVTVLDGDRLEPVGRVQTRFALHGGPKFSPDGRFVYLASRDGWISKLDLWSLTIVAEIRAGINTRNAAVSADGKFVAVANYLPHTLVLLDSELNPVKVIPVRDQSGRTGSRVSAVYDAAPRRSFVVALKDVPEVWEISYDPKAPDIPLGLVHDFRYREGSFIPGFLNPRRSVLDEVLDDFFFTRDYSELIGASREAGKGQVVNLDVRRRIASLDLPGMPHLGSGITFHRAGTTVMATTNLKQGIVSVIDLRTWKTVRQIPTLGPGFFLRSHENTRYAWVDSMMSPARDTLQVIDKQSLEVVARLTPVPGRTLAHVEFTRDGSRVLASLMEDDGAIIVFDAESFTEIRRIPMRRPVGKYNVYNKITRSEGTSH